MSTHYGNDMPHSDKLELCLDGASSNISGSTWKGHPFDCVMVNNPSYTQLGSVGYWTFNGSNQYGYLKEVNYGNNGPPVGTGSDHGVFYDLTCNVWCWTTYSSGGWTDNWAWIDFDRSEVFNFFPHGDGRIAFAGKDGVNDYFDRFSSGRVNDGQWHLASCVYSSSGKYLKLYKDGALDSTFNFSNAEYLGDRSRRWGFIGEGSEAANENGSRNSRYHDGRIGRLTLFKAAYTDDEIKQEWETHRTRFGV